MGYSGAGGKLIHEKKTRSKKSRDTVPLCPYDDFPNLIELYHYKIVYILINFCTAAIPNHNVIRFVN
jgi:hypothetical protein